MPGIMLGYSLGTNGSFKGGYLVAPLHAFKNVSLHKGTKAKIGNIPCHSNRDVHLDPDLGVYFPFKLESDRINRTLEGMVEEEETQFHEAMFGSGNVDEDIYNDESGDNLEDLYNGDGAPA